MYKNLPNICYECGATLDKESLTKEHVPPKSFFPKSDRDSLITVPACVKHNGGKSDDDEYFFQIICMQIQANEKGQDIATNKAVRGVLRNRKITKDLASNATQVYIDEDRTGQLKPTFAFKFDDEKLDNSISSICKALYYYEFHKVFIGDIKTYYEFQISLDEDSIKQNQEFEKIRHLINKNFSNIEKKGKNQDVFYYQVMEIPKGLEFSLAIRLCFYGGVGIVALLKKKPKFKFNAFMSALIKM